MTLLLDRDYIENYGILIIRISQILGAVSCLHQVHVIGRPWQLNMMNSSLLRYSKSFVAIYVHMHIYVYMYVYIYIDGDTYVCMHSCTLTISIPAKMMLIYLKIQDKLSLSWNRMEVTIGKRINNTIIPDLKDLQKVLFFSFLAHLYNYKVNNCTFSQNNKLASSLQWPWWPVFFLVVICITG